MAVDPDTIERATKFLRSRGFSADDIERAIELLSKTPPVDDADPAESISDNVVDRLLAFLRKGLEPELFEKIESALSARSESAVEPAPSTRATLAGDSFAEYFPEATRIAPDPMPRRKPAAQSSDGAAFANFAERFPEASHIGRAW